jgi:CHAT domain-containing protein
MLDYEDGIVSLEALRARTLTLIGQDELGNKAAEEALRLAQQQGTTDLIWRVEVLRGEVLLKLHREAEAEDAFRHAQTSVDQVSGMLLSDQAKIRFGVGKEDITYFLSQFDAKKTDYSRLFEDLERARARAFVDMLAGRKLAEGRQGVLVAQIQQLNQQILKQRLINYAPGNFIQKDKPRELALFEERQGLIKQLRQKDTELADVVSISAKSLAQIQSALKPGEVLLYALPPKDAEAVRFLMVDARQANIRTLAVTWGGLQKQLDQFSASIGIPAQAAQSRGLVLKHVAAEPQKIANTQQILAQLTHALDLAQWDKATTLYVVPSGVLHFIPWGALDINVPVVALPNGGWLIRNPHAFTPQSVARVVGDPAFGGDLPQLPGARQEAKQVAAVYQVPPLLGEDATEQGLRSSVGGGTKILHLATHAIYDASNPLASALYLSERNKAFPLTASALYEHPLQAQVVVMSACETGMGKITSGEDLLGLSRSFYLGGTLAIVSSLWPIEDEGTKRFMEIFHASSQNGDYGQAWLNARNQLKQQGYPPAVYGAFVLGGARLLK